MIQVRLLLDFCEITYSNEQLMTLEKILNDWIQQHINTKVKELVAEKADILTENPKTEQEIPKKLCSDAENIKFALKLMQSENVETDEDKGETVEENVVGENNGVDTEIEEYYSGEEVNSNNFQETVIEIKVDKKVSDVTPSNPDQDHQSDNKAKKDILQEAISKIQIDTGYSICFL